MRLFYKKESREKEERNLLDLLVWYLWFRSGNCANEGAILPNRNSWNSLDVLKIRLYCRAYQGFVTQTVRSLDGFHCPRERASLFQLIYLELELLGTRSIRRRHFLDFTYRQDFVSFYMPIITSLCMPCWKMYISTLSLSFNVKWGKNSCQHILRIWK